MLIGYARVSTKEQNIARQELMFEGLCADKVYVDYASGKNTDRPQLRAMLDFVREGDAVVVESISRFARNTRDFLELIDALDKKGARFVSHKENIDTNTPAGKFMLTVFAAVSELERDFLLERQREGIAIAKAAGKYKGRSRIKIDARQWDSLYTRWKAGKITAAAMRRELGISASTFYRRVREACGTNEKGDKA